jgi:hypothetical protein
MGAAQMRGLASLSANDQFLALSGGCLSGSSRPPRWPTWEEPQANAISLNGNRPAVNRAALPVRCLMQRLGCGLAPSPPAEKATARDHSNFSRSVGARRRFRARSDWRVIEPLVDERARSQL